MAEALGSDRRENTDGKSSEKALDEEEDAREAEDKGKAGTGSPRGCEEGKGKKIDAGRAETCMDRKRVRTVREREEEKDNLFKRGTQI
jgi:hypothetical protein